MSVKNDIRLFSRYWNEDGSQHMEGVYLDVEKERPYRIHSEMYYRGAGYAGEQSRPLYLTFHEMRAYARSFGKEVSEDEYRRIENLNETNVREFIEKYGRK